MSLACVTNDGVPGIRPCMYRDAHTADCDGWQYTRDDDGVEYATGRDCNGCAPREARVGMLCWGCWGKVEAEFARWDEFTAKLRAAEGRAVQRDNAGVRSSVEGHVNIPGTALSYDECWSFLKSKGPLTLTLWVSSVDGAKDAIQFGHAAARAQRTHELEEKPRKLRRVRCPECKQLSFDRNPPADAGEPVTIVCQTDGCGKLITDQAKVVEVARIERGRVA